MRYEVQYLIGGEEKSQLIDAHDAADAAGAIQEQHGRTDEAFELLSVHLIEPVEQGAMSDHETGSVLAE